MLKNVGDDLHRVSTNTIDMNVLSPQERLWGTYDTALHPESGTTQPVMRPSTHLYLTIFETDHGWNRLVVFEEPLNDTAGTYC
jgi:hypothetical protein